MARTQAISILQGTAAPANLMELYGMVIANVQKGALSTALKSQQYSGNPAAGSVEFKRFTNSKSKTYGTARAAQKGDVILAPPTTVNLDQHKEIVEEVADFDLKTFGVTNIMNRRADDHILSMSAELDRQFFSIAKTTAQVVVPVATTIQAILEEIIQLLETTHNDFIDGVDRDLMNFVLSPAKYGLIRTFLDTQSNPNVDTAGEEFGMYHGVKVYSCTRLPAATNGVLMANNSIAQPALVTPYSEPEKIQLSNDYGVSLFYDFGTKELTPDLMFTW